MKTLLLGLLALALGAGGLFAAGPLGDDPTSDRTIPLTFEPASSTTTSTTASTTSSTTPTGTTGTVEDIPGPCDEPEHANDPRCTGAAPTTTREDDDGDRGGRDEDGGDDGHGGNSGPGGGSGSGGGGGSDDRSGSNSGPG
jgi:hypothetical protein